MTDDTADPGAWAEEEARNWNGFGHAAHVVKGLLARIDHLRRKEAEAREAAARACFDHAEARAAAGDAAGAAAARACAEAIRGGT